MESPTASSTGRAGNIFAFNYAIPAAAGALVSGLEHGNTAVSFASGALFIGAREADAGSPAAGTFLRGVMSRRVNHSRQWKLNGHHLGYWLAALQRSH